MKKMFGEGVLLLVVMVVCLSATGVAYAGQPDLKAPPPEQSKAYKETGIESLQYLQDWNCSFALSGDGIDLTGYTQAFQNVDYIYLINPPVFLSLISFILEMQGDRKARLSVTLRYFLI